MMQGGVDSEAEQTKPSAATLGLDVVRRRTAELMERVRWSRPKLIALQQAQLKTMLSHAVARSRYYRDTLGQLVEQGASLEDLPILSKSTLMTHFDELLTDRRLSLASIESHVAGDDDGASLLLGKYRTAATGGTTGRRSIFVYDEFGWENLVANNVRFQRIQGVIQETRSMGIGAPSPIHLSNRLFSELRVGRPSAPRLHLTMPMEDVVASLNAYQPEVLTTYPSFMRHLAEEQLVGRLKISPRLIRSAAEALPQDVRDAAWVAWKAPIANGYATTETGVIAGECQHINGMHIAEDLLVVEVVDDGYRPVQPGVQGTKVLVTTLTNSTLPLVRYEIADWLTLADGECSCGSPLRRIAHIEGRSEDILVVRTHTGESKPIHAARLWFYLVKVAGIRRYQFAQLPDGIQILLVVHHEYDAAKVRQAAHRIALDAFRSLGVDDTARIDIQVLESLERVGTGAKEKLVVPAIPIATS